MYEIFENYSSTDSYYVFGMYLDFLSKINCFLLVDKIQVNDVNALNLSMLRQHRQFEICENRIFSLKTSTILRILMLMLITKVIFRGINILVFTMGLVGKFCLTIIFTFGYKKCLPIYHGNRS